MLVVVNGLEILVALENNFEQLGESCDKFAFGIEVCGKVEEKLATELVVQLVGERGLELHFCFVTFLFLIVDLREVLGIILRIKDDKAIYKNRYRALSLKINSPTVSSEL